MDGVFAQWNVEEDRDTGEDIESQVDEQHHLADMVIKDVKFSFERAEKVAVIGRVGSGKTSLFLTILDELCLIKGRVSMSSKSHIAYAE